MISNYNIDEWIKLYNDGVSITEISRLYRLKFYNVRRELSKVLILRTGNTWARKYHCNSNAFSEINSEESAYWLGFLYADGCMRKDCIGVNLLLNQDDAGHILKFKTFLNSNSIIEERVEKIRDKNKNIIRLQRTAKIRINDRKLFSDLEKLGCIRLKTRLLKFPSFDIVPKEFMSHFIRGVFDGDGSVWVSHSKSDPKRIKSGFSITGASEFMESMRDFLDSEIGIKGFLANHKSHGIKILSYSSIESIMLIKDYFYKDSKVFLDRKKEKFETLPTKSIVWEKKKRDIEILEYIKNNPRTTIKDINKLYPMAEVTLQILLKKMHDDKLVDRVFERPSYFYSIKTHE